MDIGFDAGIKYYAWSVCLGIALSFLYDVIRASRIIRRPSDITVNIIDVVYAIIFGLSVFATAYEKNDGRLRLQGFLGVITGGVVYYTIFKNHITEILVAGWEIIIKIWLWIIKILLFPIRLVCKVFEKPFTVVVWHTGKGIKQLKEIFRTRAEKKRQRKLRIKQERKKKNSH